MSEDKQFYITSTKGGAYPRDWRKQNYELYDDLDTAIVCLKEHMVSNGCKDNNFRTIKHYNEDEQALVEIRNLHEVDKGKYPSVPMTGYIHPVNLIQS